MMKMQTKEHLVYFMQTGMMRLSHYDLHFVQNLNYIILNKNIEINNIFTIYKEKIIKFSIIPP